MILIIDQPGQLGNQLWAYTNMIAIAKSCRSSICIVLQEENYRMLDIGRLCAVGSINIFSTRSLQGRSIVRIANFIKYRQSRKGMIGSLLHQLPVEFVNGFVSENDFINHYKHRFLYIVNSWEMRTNTKSFIRHSRDIRSLVQPTKNISHAVLKEIDSFVSPLSVLVGVHVRRGDYKNFLGGKFYFEDSVYASYMLQISTLLQPFKVVFRIFSNEPVNTNNFEGLNVEFNAKHPALGDMWGLSLCNLIIGPVSTFSMWASFWNKVPLYFIRSTNQILSLKDFDVIVAQDLFRRDVLSLSAKPEHLFNA